MRDRSAVAKVALGLASALFLLTASAADRPVKKNKDYNPAAAPAGAFSFGRPGIQVKIVSAAIAQDGTITARVTIADPKGVPLDRDGINTPGAVSMSLIAAYIPAGKSQYVSYTTTTLAATLNKNPSQVQAANDSGGTFTRNADGDYTYTFKTKAPAGFDANATHAIGVSVNRDLSEFITYTEWTEVANDVYNFVPNGSPVKVTRSVVSTKACNGCHDPLIGHGGSRIKVELCILCHTPQSVNPDTQLTQDMPVLIHKLHSGANLPSVKAGGQYRIWHRGNWSDFTTVQFPRDTRDCTVCHTGSPQADNWKTNPTIAACGACHDDVNFATGKNHVDYPVTDETQCKNCHAATATGDFDASIPGAHVVPTYAKALPGIVMSIQNVTNAVPGSAPTVTFKVVDKSGKPVDISKLTQIRVLLAGPNDDYKAGATGIQVSENPAAVPGTNGVYVYTMTNKIPAGSTGSYTISLQARNNVTLMPGTLKEQVASDNAVPVEYYFSVDKSKVQPRRVVVATEKCAACHKDLAFVHGGTRGNTQECVICHNPTLSDSTSKVSVSYATQIHSIHRGENRTTPYVIGATNYQEVRFPGDLRDCNQCHVGASYQVDNVGATAMVATPGWINPSTPPISAACLGCHDTRSATVHASLNSNQFGESCVVCHGIGTDFAVDTVHSRSQ
jgi:OmcA/MtrC family decaheme c-type cytochrome